MFVLVKCCINTPVIYLFACVSMSRNFEQYLTCLYFLHVETSSPYIISVNNTLLMSGQVRSSLFLYVHLSFFFVSQKEYFLIKCRLFFYQLLIQINYESTLYRGIYSPCVYLQANVMLEYELDDAEKLLVKNQEAAIASLEQVDTDLGFLRDQLTTIEVSILSPAFPPPGRQVGSATVASMMFLRFHTLSGVLSIAFYGSVI